VCVCVVCVCVCVVVVTDIKREDWVSVPLRRRTPVPPAPPRSRAAHVFCTGTVMDGTCPRTCSLTRERRLYVGAVDASVSVPMLVSVSVLLTPMRAFGVHVVALVTS
jgi:hypothetical protein